MRKWMLAAGAAALAFAGPALADPKGDKGGGKGQQAQQGGGGKAAKADRGGGREVKAARVGNDRVKPKGRDADSRRAVKIDRDRDRVVVRDRRDRDDVRVVRARDFDDDDRIVIRRAFDGGLFPGRGRGLIAGCPPGLDKKDNGCLPPGQAKKLFGSVLPLGLRSSLLPASRRNWFRDDDDYLFRAGNGFIYRVDRDDFRVSGLIPMVGSGGYYALGDPWPQPYNFYNVPNQYQSFFRDDDDDCYRYDGFGAIYRVDCDRGVVNSIVALLAGDIGAGSRLPLGYDAYNVPLAFRPTYFDTPTAMYRYNDGYIYRVDPTTRLVTAVINALV